MQIHGFISNAAGLNNYQWLINNPRKKEAIIVDPVDYSWIKLKMAETQSNPSAILITHYDFDHIYALAELLKEFDCPVYAPSAKKLSMINHPLNDGDLFVISDYKFRTIATPGHRIEHLAFFCDSTNLNPPIVVCGDTLLGGGCGKVFTQDFAAALQSLHKLMTLPPETKILCGHANEKSNFNFAQNIEPNNAELNRRVREHKIKEGNLIYSTINQELATNPFLRCKLPAVRQQAEEYAGKSLNSELEVFTTIRQWKDNY